ncbi:hypothetical protein [Kutzneria sp. NPDC051319]|uniref:hypothetical protein n=1 Tax=Kutzneria sp. NPDC051319 TaxID=3155047 RepID=UPI00343F3AA1
MALKLALSSALIALAVGGTAHACNAIGTTSPTGPGAQVPLTSGQAVYDGDGIHVECRGATPMVVKPLSNANVTRANQVCAELAHDYSLLESAVQNSH